MGNNLDHPFRYQRMLLIAKALSVTNDAPPQRKSLGYPWRPNLQPTVLLFTKNKPPEDLTDLYKAFKKWNLSKYPPDSGKYKRRGIIRIK